MAYALVRAGTIATSTTGTITPAFGQATTAGNLLVARIVRVGATGDLASHPGWVQAGSGTPGADIWYKPNCSAGESAPSFGGAGSTTLFADLLEFSGGATSSPVDKVTVASGNLTPANPSADTAAGELCVLCCHVVNSKAATFTFTDNWLPSGGSVVGAQGTGATKQIDHMWGSAYITSSNASADNNAIGATPSTGTLTTGSCAYTIASFKLFVAQQVSHNPVVVAQAIARAGNW